MSLAAAMRIPIVEHFQADPLADLRQKVETLAESLRREQPSLATPSKLRDLIPSKLNDGPALHLDDLSEISRLDPGNDTRFYQDGAELRAMDGDFVASCGGATAFRTTAWEHRENVCQRSPIDVSRRQNFIQNAVFKASIRTWIFAMVR